MKRLLILLLIVCLLLSSCVAVSHRLPDGICMRLVFFSVGQGDATLIRTPVGDVLIDAGPESSQSELCRKLKREGVTTLMLAVFTHPDEDHIGGADGVLEEFDVQRIWLPAAEGEEESYLRLLDAAREKKVPIDRVAVGEHFQLGEVHLAVLSPLPNAFGESNDQSIVLKLLCQDASVMFSGDAGSEVEEELLQSCCTLLDVDIYKVSHHGSNSSSGEAFLAAMSPEWAVIECGEGNAYGHPHGAVLERLKDCGAKVLRTDLDGDVIFDCGGRGFTHVNG